MLIISVPSCQCVVSGGCKEGEIETYSRKLGRAG